MEYRTIGRGSTVSLLGFGCMRFPTKNKKIDEPAAAALLERAYEAGVNYFDTAWPYHDGASEEFTGRILSKFERASYMLATKLPVWLVESTGDVRRFVSLQLERLKTDYIDFYLLHALNGDRWTQLERLGAYAELETLRNEGLIRNIGFSFHDGYDAFERILRAHPWDFCQIQYNYVDVDEQAGDKGYLLAEELGIPVVIMEPLKGGSLASLPEDAMAPFRAIDPQASAASWSLRWLAAKNGVRLILSGMSAMDQLEDNISTCSDPRMPAGAGNDTFAQVRTVLESRVRNSCTGCRYCMPCPFGVDIPRNFTQWNTWGKFENRSNARWEWHNPDFSPARADVCTSCGACIPKCPQHIDIPSDLARTRAELDGIA